MFKIEDRTYQDIREKSLMQWLEEMERHEDVAVRGGVQLCREYVEYLKQQNEKLKDAGALKDQYLKRLSGREK